MCIAVFVELLQELLGGSGGGGTGTSTSTITIFRAVSRQTHGVFLLPPPRVGAHVFHGLFCHPAEFVAGLVNAHADRRNHTNE